MGYELFVTCVYSDVSGLQPRKDGEIRQSDPFSATVAGAVPIHDYLRRMTVSQIKLHFSSAVCSDCNLVQ